MDVVLGHLNLSLSDAVATRILGSRLAQASLPGTVILLRGPLGAGKTTLVEGFVDALHGGRAASPTFVLAHAYLDGRMPIWHLDLFRLEDPRDVEDLDLAHYMPADGVTLVEWADRAGDVWPEDRIEVDLSIAGHAREAHVCGVGKCAALVANLANVVPRS